LLKAFRCCDCWKRFYVLLGNELNRCEGFEESGSPTLARDGTMLLAGCEK
jgi:hypothetical protein